MTPAQMTQLIQNIRRDGALTSAILCYRPPGQDFTEILSGHHRTEAAIAAELPKIPMRLIVSPLTEQRKRAIQLSHNAIVGQDDPSVLASMYADLDLASKIYSGLEDTVMEAMAKVSLSGLSVSIKYKEMTLFFLSDEAKAVAEAMPRIEKAARKEAAYVAAYRDFDAFFDLVIRAKSKFKSFNSGVTFRMIIDLATQALDAMEASAVADEQS